MEAYGFDVEEELSTMATDWKNKKWQDELGIVHDVPQGEGGEQGDALMPALFSLGQHPAFEAVQSELLEALLLPRRRVCRLQP